MANGGQAGTSGQNNPAGNSGRTPAEHTIAPEPRASLSLTEALARLRSRRETGEPTPPESGSQPATQRSAPGSAGKSEPTARVSQDQPHPDDQSEDGDQPQLGLLAAYAPEEPSGDSGDPGGDDPDDPIVFEHEGAQIRRKEARAGYLRQSAYTTATQKLSTQQQAFEAAIAQTSQVRDALQGLLVQAQHNLQANAPRLPAETLRLSDPLAYNEQVAAYVVHQEQVKANEAAQAKLRQDHLIEQQALSQARLQTEMARMEETIPSLKRAKTPDAKAAVIKQLAQSAKALGFTDQEIGGFNDHRYWRALELVTIGLAAVTQQRKAGDQRRTATGQFAGPAGAQGKASGPAVTLKGATSSPGGSAPTEVRSAEQAVAAAKQALGNRHDMGSALALRKAERRLREARARSQPRAR